MAEKESENSNMHEFPSIEISETVSTLIFSYFLESSIVKTSFVLFLNFSRLNTRQKLSSKGYNLFVVANLKIWTLPYIYIYIFYLIYI